MLSPHLKYLEERQAASPILQQRGQAWVEEKRQGVGLEHIPRGEEVDVFPGSELALFVITEAERTWFCSDCIRKGLVRELLLTTILVQMPLQHLLILLQSQLSPYTSTAFITLPWKDFLPVLTIISFPSLTVISPCNGKG